MFRAHRAERRGKIDPFSYHHRAETADRGEVVVPRGVRVGYLTQEAEVSEGSTVRAELLASREDITAHYRAHA